jgi:MFS family permease
MLLLAPLAQVAPVAALLFLAGLFFAVLGANANTIVQLRAPDTLRGRVLGLYLFAFAGLTPLGGLLAGSLVEVGGTRLSLAVAGLAGLAVTALALRLREPPDPRAPNEGLRRHAARR